MDKVISSRAIIFEDDNVYTMFRRKLKKSGKLKEYYVAPGGKPEGNETLEETVIRELKEEFSVGIRIIKYIGKKENKKAIAHYFYCEIISGTPVLGGEELERCSETNYYEIRLIPVKEIKNIDIPARKFIRKAYQEPEKQ